MKSLMTFAIVAGLSAQAVAASAGEPLAGRWDAHLIRANNDSVPFRLDLSGDGTSLKGTLYDGFRPYEYTSSASATGDTLLLKFDHYLTTITAHREQDRLVGEVVANGRGGTTRYDFVATRHTAGTASPAGKAPDVAGQWEVPLSSANARGERSVRLAIEQRDDEIAASILRVDGDTGAYSGTFRDGRWQLSHYDGSRPGVLEIVPRPDGTLEIHQRTETLTAYRPETARAKGFAPPADVLANTRARDAQETFAFSFHDVNGKLVTQDDPDFRGKVVVAIVTGTWCPNCHDEAKYLVQLDAKYRARGLRIVALDFEEPEQLGTLARVRAFTAQYGVTYPYLIAGAPDELAAKIPQLENLNTWPATVFVGRDGTVRAVHSGFASPATGALHIQLQQEFTSRIEALLAEKPSTARR
jgi:thiol-disulfide isomerase/thioredoxin